ncbi:hypothetical protein VD0002_g5947 [Verticillium dahliae]|uniref:Uncharacterized protein n=2 Tax=Verticillium dahliae TaxID=27337 RepID=G2WZ00_VERDV|nr:uncharacterized protein VDAG_03242 [Verticillium dahliae VdLs.17]KAF3344802.1 Putative inactive purple acid phosphatase 16 [Verticillium dahliae VDG2]KAF3358072.1 hypothetical protein VdG1_02849 [Verticillium dahliae VDG1]KAH6663450.1 hypothetical protein EV126DRAFT_352500 [Verticillium dahliae]EGY21802.1 hypothetical protein VDAG_03242 [Verticillium dahliae VdLs.17]KAH6703635.1 hypothetical protein EV126DRAFT_337101 [Verticillium dahliae]
MSSISRAFTTRRVKQSIDVAAAANKANKENGPQRSKTTKTPHVSVRHQISAPVELIHTTNMLSYNAPDISRNTSSSNSTKSAESAKSSDEEPDSPSTVASTPPTSPDVDRDEQSKSMQPNHLSCYFVAPVSAKDYVVPEVPPVPAIPKRSPSHTKKASYDAIARQRSISAMSRDSDHTLSTKASFSYSRTSSASTAASTMSHNSMTPSIKPPVPSIPPVAYQQQQKPAIIESHPFGRELAQVSEIAEDYGIKHSILDEEEQALKAQGLYKHSAEDYMGEVQSLFHAFFQESYAQPQSHARPAAAEVWI